MNGATDAPFSDNTIYVAIELSISGWLVGLRTSGDGKTALYKLRSGDLDALLTLMGAPPSERASVSAVMSAFWPVTEPAAMGSGSTVR